MISYCITTITFCHKLLKIVKDMKNVLFFNTESEQGIRNNLLKAALLIFKSCLMIIRVCNINNQIEKNFFRIFEIIYIWQYFRIIFEILFSLYR